MRGTASRSSSASARASRTSWTGTTCPATRRRLKLALADYVFTRYVLQQGQNDAAEAVRKHLFYAQAILCYRVAKSYLTERPGDAYTVGMLLVPYVCEVKKVEK